MPSHRTSLLARAPNPSERLVWMDTVRALAIALVVFHHSVEHVAASLGTTLGPLTVLDDSVDPFRIVTLMFLSGLLLQRSLTKSAGVFVAGKLGRIGWPYLLWSVAVLAALHTSNGVSDHDDLVPGRAARVFYDPPTYLWYLAYLLIFYLVCLVVPPVARTIMIPAAVVAAFLVAAEDDLQRLFFVLAFFLLGDFFTRHGRALDEMLESPLLLGLATAGAIVTAVAAGAGLSVRYEATWAVGAACGVLVLVWFGRRLAATSAGRWISRYGRDSLVFYVTHWIGLRVGFEILSHAGVTNRWLLLLGAFSAGVGVGFVFVAWRRRWRPVNYLFELPLTGLLRRLRSRARTRQEGRHRNQAARLHWNLSAGFNASRRRSGRSDSAARTG